jgi:hypothetical protein
MVVAAPRARTVSTRTAVLVAAALVAGAIALRLVDPQRSPGSTTW